MKQANDPIPCSAIQDELAALLYGELEGDSSAQVERHLESCDACRGVLEGFARTKHALDAWSPPASGDAGDAWREAREVARGARRRSLVAHRKRSVLLGLAASLLVFLGLSALGAELDWRAGRVTLSFELPWISSESELADAGDWTQEMRRIARAAADERLAAWDASQGGRLADWSLREAEERSRLVHAIDRARELDRESFANVLSSFQRGAAQEIRFTREAVTELASFVARERQP